MFLQLRQENAQVQGKQSDVGAMMDLEWPPCEEEFIIALEEEGWCVCCGISFEETSNTFKAHQLQPIKTWAKDDAGKTYWIYSQDERVETYLFFSTKARLVSYWSKVTSEILRKFQDRFLTLIYLD